MAKLSVIVRQKKRERLVALYAEKRARLKKEGDYAALDKLPRNASPVRLRNRCSFTGRARSYIRRMGVCRQVFRDLASRGDIPGVKKVSW